MRKFINRVEQISFRARRALETDQEVLYVTERAVFRLTDRGLELTEIAPGVDLKTHVLSQMDFSPIIHNVRSMPECLFIKD